MVTTVMVRTVGVVVAIVRTIEIWVAIEEDVEFGLVTVKQST
jgi:hypothetical protein